MIESYDVVVSYMEELYIYEGVVQHGSFDRTFENECDNSCCWCVFQSLPTLFGWASLPLERRGRPFEKFCDKFVIYENRHMRAFETFSKMAHPFFHLLFLPLLFFHLFLITSSPLFMPSNAICLKAISSFSIQHSTHSYKNINFFFFTPVVVNCVIDSIVNHCSCLKYQIP